MNGPESYQPTDDDTNGDDPVIDQPHARVIQHEFPKQKHGEQAHPRTAPSKASLLAKPLDRYAPRIEKTSWDRKVELTFACAIVIFSGIQLYITITNNNSSSRQVDKLIAARESDTERGPGSSQEARTG